MIRILQSLAALLILCIAGISARASHFLGGEIGYSFIAPNVVIAEFKGFYDCAGTTPPSSMQFAVKSPACGSPQVVTGNLQGSIFRSLNPYCISVPQGCNSTTPLNILEAKYAATIILSANCPEWLLSVQECSAAAVANLASTGLNCVYLESYINMAAVGQQPVSPQFMPVPALFFTVNSPATILNLAQTQYSGDSLVYSLKPAMSDSNTPAVYNSGFTFSAPFPSSSGVNLHSQTGLLSFTPNVFNNVTGYDANAYTFVVEVAAYNKVNGVMTKISTSQRRIQALIVNNAPNQSPEITNVTANGQPVQPGVVFPVQSGGSLTLHFSTFDANTGDSVSFHWGGRSSLDTTFAATNGIWPTGTVTFQVPHLQQDQLLFVPVTIKDNACPVRGVTSQVYIFKVLANSLGINKVLPSHAGFSAYPNPFSETVHFKLNAGIKAQTILIYNLLGQRIDEIQLKTVGSGEQKVQWQNASKHTAGIYIAKLVSKDKTIQNLKFTKLQ